MLVEVAIFVIIFILVFVKFNQRPAGLPPGEWGLPIIGYFPKGGEKMTNVIGQLRKKHGDIFSVMFGSRLNVLLCDYELIRSTFAKHSTAARPDIFSLNFISNSKNTGILMSNGSIWHSNRRFAIRVLKDFGLGKSTLEDSIKVETEYFINILKENTNKPFKVGYSLNVVILNVVWGLIAGKRFDVNDEEIKTFTKLLVDTLTTKEGPMRFLDIYPGIIPYVPHFVMNHWMKVEALRENRDHLHDYFQKVIKECEKKLNKDDPRHYIDMYLIEREEQRDNPEFKHRICDNSDLVTTITDLFVAGSDTTAATLKWMFLYMAKYPDVQKKIQKEIDSVVPRSRFPQLDDKKSLPYMEAAIHDLQRVISFVPTGVPHEMVEDEVIKGYNIPKGTIIISCIELVHRDKKYWKRPDDLYPEHFLDKDGKFTIQKEGYMPFSLGRRQCPGEALAKMELFLFTSAILQNFEISEPEGRPITLKPDPIADVVNVPREQDLILKYRK